MASAIIGGLLKQGGAPESLQVVEPFEASRNALRSQFKVDAIAKADESLERADLVVWAVKPQNLREAAGQAGPFCKDALHLSVAAGIRSDSLAQWLGSQRIVRAMPNTPALVGLGQTGLFARSAFQTTTKPGSNGWSLARGNFCGSAKRRNWMQLLRFRGLAQPMFSTLLKQWKKLQ